MVVRTGFVACAPGLEALLAEELASLGLAEATAMEGGASFRGTLADAQRANLGSRLGLFVLVRMVRFSVQRFESYERRLAELPWETVIPEGASLELRVHTSKCRLRHSGELEARTRAAIGARVSLGDDAPIRIHIRGKRDRFFVSFDASGEPLHRRGYRRGTAKAPLRPDLAAAALALSPWSARAGLAPLVDPFCGSGTVAIEAAMIARGVVPGNGRSFAIERAPAFAGEASAVRARAVEAAAAALPAGGSTTPIYASDRDEGAVRIATENAARAGVSDAIAFATKPLSASDGFTPDAHLVTNPPWGRRVSAAQDLRGLYQRLAARSEQLASATIVAGNLDIVRSAGVVHSRLARLSGTGLSVHILSLREGQ